MRADDDVDPRDPLGIWDGNPPPEDDPFTRPERPTVLLSEPRAQQVEALTRALAASGTTFRQGDGLVSVACLSAEEREREQQRTGIDVPPDQPRIVPVNAARLCRIVDDVALVRNAHGKPTDLPLRLAEHYVNSGAGDDLPELRGVSHTPLLRSDGTVCAVPGYDQQARLWLAEGVADLALPPKPRRRDAEAALEKLRDLLQEYPFVTDLDAVVAVAFVMTAALRGSMRIAPMLVADANKPRTGKGHLIRTIALIATGRGPAVIAAGSSRDEREKRMSQTLTSRAPFVSLDNINGELASDDLCSFLAEGEARVRSYGSHGTAPLAIYSGTIAATGNNFRARGDLATRVLPCRQDARIPNPGERTFRMDPHQRALEGRTGYLAAVFAIARWGLVGVDYRAPEDARGNNGFDEWARLVRLPLLALTGCDVLDAIRDAETEGVGSPEDGEAFAAIAKLFPKGKTFGASDLEKEKHRNGAALDSLPDRAVLIGYWLRNRRDCYRGGFWLRRVTDATQGERTGHRWVMEPG